MYDKDVSDRLQEQCGVFVTLHIGKKLRGCIGTMRGTEPLIDTVRDMARSSAFHDPRFPGLTLDEIKTIKIEISVLTPLIQISSVDEIKTGTHGLYITKGPCSGVLLPQVAIEQGWDRDQFLSFTCRKAGLPADAWYDNDTIIEIFSATIFSE